MPKTLSLILQAQLAKGKSIPGTPRPCPKVSCLTTLLIAHSGVLITIGLNIDTVAIIRVPFNGSFDIHLFIGDIKDTQPERYITKKNEVGFSGVFASTHDAPCANCLEQREQGFICEDAIPITSSLYDYPRSNTAQGPETEMCTLETFHPEHVVPFLKQHLRWVVTDTASKLINDDQKLIKSELEILVLSRAYDIPTSTSPLGLYHASEDYPEITAGKIGGHRDTGITAA